MNNQNENSRTDEALVERVLNGDTNAFRTIMNNTEGLVAQIIFKMVADGEDRRDLAQDVYLKVFKKLSGFRFNSKLSTWVGQIAYNTCLNYLQKKRLVLVDENDFDGFNQLYSDEAESLVLTKELSQVLRIEIDKLSPLYRTLITLYHNEDLSYSMIAQITELPEGTVKNYLFRARKVLRDKLLHIYNKEVSR
ncbi:RNA polymerase sigma factor [Flavihumibacter solisilvae]|uniref:RNA polymerase subunit sigma-24 n=1 Tax=Flavihumibacter solisilvae TaxID=1349421 RepID=A0A0C1LCA5_9BACT|nr:sigma-70 family RNA polymerase sigma factor [Flavihumibacter solisilvae]KIC93123.1 RNA polymerase subunit sigma-24 [Flavihumibacter solisilvae]